jgi:hypothetical protein
MALRWLIPLGALLSLSSFAAGGGWLEGAKCPALLPRHAAGYLLLPQESQNASYPLLPYEPQPGDIILYDNDNKFHHLLFKLARTRTPIHVSIVVARQDGTPAILELTGPVAVTAKVVLLEVGPRLSTYPGTMMVRRLRQPLTAEQSCELTAFAEMQVGKRFSVGRVLLQATPFCPHSGLRRTLWGRTHLDRQRWICSEMVVAAGTVAQIFDPLLHPANATHPCDLAYDDTMDLSSLYHPPLPWVAERAAVEPSSLSP